VFVYGNQWYTKSKNIGTTLDYGFRDKKAIKIHVVFVVIDTDVVLVIVA
jgi:hypothetical protein